MMKELYDEPIIEVLCFEKKDVVRTSDNDWNWSEMEPVF